MRAIAFVICMFVATVFAAFPGVVHAGERDKLVLVAPVIPPYYEITKDGRDVGVLHDLFETIASDAGYQWERVTLPPKRAIRYFVTAESTITIAVHNPAFSELPFILVADKPIGEMVLNVYQPATRPALTDLQSLKNRHLVLMHGYGYGGLRTWLDDPASGIDQVVTSSYSEGIRLVERDFVDGALYYDVNYDLAIRQMGYRPDNIVTRNLVRVPLYIQINRKTLPGARKVLDNLMQSHERLIKNGSIKLLGSLVGG